MITQILNQTAEHGLKYLLNDNYSVVQSETDQSQSTNKHDKPYLRILNVTREEVIHANVTFQLRNSVFIEG